MTAFQRPDAAFADLSPDTSSQLLAVVSDVSLVLDAQFKVVDAAVSTDELPEGIAGHWIGQPVRDLVLPAEQHKLEDLFSAAGAARPVRWRQLSLAGPLGTFHVLQCIAVRMHGDGRLLLAGRGLQAMAKLQQRLLQAQQTLENDYWQFRDAETRYRHLFESSAEGVLVLDADTLQVREANPAAKRLLALAGEEDLLARPLPALLGADGDAVRVLLSRVRVSGRAEELALSALGAQGGGLLSASALRQAGAAQLLVRLSPREALRAAEAEATATWADLARATPDAQVLTTGDGLVLAANGAFLELAQLGAEDQVRGQSIDRWLDRGSVDLSVLVTNLRQRGVVRLYAARLRGALGSTVDVEIAAATVSTSPDVLGFTIRDISRRLSPSPRGLQDLPKSVSQLTELVGRVPMKDIVGETSELIEQLCIEAALELTRGNRVSAAEMLGISRQSLYVKMRRYGLQDQSQETEK